MTRASLLSFVALAALPGALAAQGAVTKDAPGGSIAQAQRAIWQGTIRNITLAAEEWPEADYGWKPTESVRTFGQMVAHVAGAQYSMCAPALGEQRDAAEADVEKAATTKAAIVAELKKSTEYCERAYRISDAEAAQGIQMWGAPRTKLFAIAMNANHNAEHYGNLVTYMRIKGVVPPSSRRQ